MVLVLQNENIVQNNEYRVHHGQKSEKKNKVQEGTLQFDALVKTTRGQL